MCTPPSPGCQEIEKDVDERKDFQCWYCGLEFWVEKLWAPCPARCMDCGKMRTHLKDGVLCLSLKTKHVFVE